MTASVLNEDIKKASEVIRNGGIVIYPTETVYGLGADASNLDAVMRISKIKNRRSDQPISIAVSNIRMLHEAACLDDTVKHFINTFLPGPVTVIVPRKAWISDVLTGGSDRIGIRWPDHPVTELLIESAGRPITSTSANTTGKAAPTKLKDVEKEIIRNVDFIIDGGECRYGEPSTVVDMVNRKIIRKGSLSQSIILALEEME